MNTKANSVNADEQKRDEPGHANDAAERVGQAADTMASAAEAVHSNVTSGIQPDMRSLRNLMADQRDTISIAFRRIFWAIIAVVALNLITLIVVLSR